MELKSRDLIFPSLNLTWVYRELNQMEKQHLASRTNLKPPKINSPEFLSLEVTEQLFSTPKIILNCSHQMFISTVQNTHSRDNTRTANKNYNHTDWNAAALKGITVPLHQTVSFCQVMMTSRPHKNSIKNKHRLWIAMVRCRLKVQAFPFQPQIYTSSQHVYRILWIQVTLF